MAKLKEFRVVTLEFLVQRSEYDVDAFEALTKVRAIQASGGTPEIKYSELHGWQVTDVTPR